MVVSTIATQDDKVATNKVWASQGKYARAEPCSALYEKGRVHHVGHVCGAGRSALQLGPRRRAPSPNELDACVWALTELMLGTQIPAGLSLAPALDLRQRPLAQRATRMPGQLRPRDASMDDSVRAIQEAVRRRWGVSGYDEYDDV